MSAVELDDIDRSIIQILQEDGRVPFLTIANQLGVAEGTIRRRVARMMDENILQIVGITDPQKVGMHTVALVGLSVERRRIEDTIVRLKDMPEVRYVAVATGMYDIIIEIVVPSNDALLEFLIGKLNEIPWIVDTGTSLVLKIAKQDLAWAMEN
ncbi:MAG: Lrp/AsnC family transcriptional regulator [Candidatus Wallacebacter cryptica]|jgi:Lrp/AsnC family transcriptional regulator for asnA, asnC and gidA|nr:Lrp/AsnC family transcriptional regulator [Bacillota bacterium]